MESTKIQIDMYRCPTLAIQLILILSLRAAVTQAWVDEEVRAIPLLFSSAIDLRDHGPDPLTAIAWAGQFTYIWTTTGTWTCYSAYHPDSVAGQVVVVQSGESVSRTVAMGAAAVLSMTSGALLEIGAGTLLTGSLAAITEVPIGAPTDDAGVPTALWLSSPTAALSSGAACRGPAADSGAPPLPVPSASSIHRL